ncbi:uncharacterized protein GGS22DRAFT_194637 [Annulohypoxylon maeteangense]|uniref:uncharacterized protein n=1 Tax=Annulohypoxylon maeteangense TaxID=1927788 RepID=UPI0020086591|nr:uncharacterized protein GGS22DRAFT_194637 [Annulohypoxylon maeteangense]KAI0890746.1 hypothetical protein GGS22DRAFT_194637 [Annulohypoxylon maeteangense]
MDTNPERTNATNTVAHPFIVTDLSQPDLTELRYGNLLPKRRVKREVGFDEWMDNWKKEFIRLNFNFHNRRHVFDVAYAFNLAEVSRHTISNEKPDVIADLYLGSEEVEIGLRMAVAETGAWVPTGDLLTDDAPAFYAPRPMFSKDRAAVTDYRYMVFPVHSGRLNHWTLLVYDNSTPNFLSFLDRNRINAQGVTFHPKEIPDQVGRVSCGWICLESARAYLHEGLDDWTKSTLYRDFIGADRSIALEKAAVTNWANWGAVWWRGSKETFYPVQPAQSQLVVNQAQQVQETPAEQAIQAHASTSGTQTLPPQLPPATSAVEGTESPGSPSTLVRVVRDELKGEKVSREQAYTLFEFINYCHRLSTQLPKYINVREYHSILSSNGGDFKKAGDEVLRRLPEE